MNPRYLEDQWNDYRRRQRLLLYTIPLFFIGSAIAGSLAEYLAIPELFIVVATVLAFMYILAANYVFWFKCPFCDKNFASGVFWRSPIRCTCLHCGKAVGCNS
jgi:hypothetical protein